MLLETAALLAIPWLPGVPGACDARVLVPVLPLTGLLLLFPGTLKVRAGAARRDDRQPAVR